MVARQVGRRERGRSGEWRYQPGNGTHAVALWSLAAGGIKKPRTIIHVASLNFDLLQYWLLAFCSIAELWIQMLLISSPETLGETTDFFLGQQHIWVLKPAQRETSVSGTFWQEAWGAR